MSNGLNVHDLIIESIFIKFLKTPVVNDVAFEDIDSKGKKVPLSSLTQTQAAIDTATKTTKNTIYKKANIAQQSVSDANYMKRVYEMMPMFKYLRELINIAKNDTNFEADKTIKVATVNDLQELYFENFPNNANKNSTIKHDKIETLKELILNIRNYITPTTTDKEKKKVLNKITSLELKSMLKTYKFNDILTNLPTQLFRPGAPPTSQDNSKPTLPDFHFTMLHFLSLTLLKTPDSYPPAVYGNGYYDTFFRDPPPPPSPPTKLIDREDLEEPFFKGFLEVIGHYITINNAKWKYDLSKLVEYAYGIKSENLKKITDATLPAAGEVEFWDWASPQQGGMLYRNHHARRASRRASKKSNGASKTRRR
jgi:hypothetical protein